MQHLPPDRTQLATKTDLATLGAELRGEMAELRGEMTGLRGEMTGLRGEMEGMEGRIDRKFGKIDGQFGELRGEMVAMGGAWRGGWTKGGITTAVVIPGHRALPHRRGPR
ncbi:MAG: hypothetical protein OXG91_10400 [bacterium]|nr:hypothetical protein [bacterium]